MASVGVIIESKKSGIIFLSCFSTQARIATPIITPIIPPFPGIKILLSGTSALYKPKAFENIFIFELIVIAPIIPPRAGVAPNSLAEFTPTNIAKYANSPFPKV